MDQSNAKIDKNRHHHHHLEEQWKNITFLITKSPSELQNQRLLTCFESTLHKLKLLRVIPELCNRIVTGTDYELERILGFSTTKLLLQLFFTQMAWLESNNNNTRASLSSDPTENNQLFFDNKTSWKLNRNVQNTGMYNNNGKVIPKKDNDCNTLNNTTREINSRLKGSTTTNVKKNSFGDTNYWNEPENSEKREESCETCAASSMSSMLFIPNLVKDSPDQARGRSSTESSSSSSLAYQISTDETDLLRAFDQMTLINPYKYDNNKFYNDKDDTCSNLANDIKKLYKKLLQQLGENELFDVWFQQLQQEGSDDKQMTLFPIQHEVESSKYNERMEKNFIRNSNSKIKQIFQVSDAFYIFENCLNHLYELMKTRLLFSYEDSIKIQDSTKTFWIREKYYNKKVAKVNNNLETLKVSRIKKLKALGDEVNNLQIELQKVQEERFQQIRQIMKDLQISNLINEKVENVKRTKVEELAQSMRVSQLNVGNQLAKESLALQTKKQELENTLTTIISQYDEVLIEKQRLLDDLERQEAENMIQIKCLTQAVEDTQEQFEEMRNTKKLKEILRNIAMADDFRENRAARIIQMAWHRYKYRQRRKLRRKRRFKRKPKSGPTPNLFMQYCTPQDHVRALKKKSLPIIKEEKPLKHKTKKPPEGVLQKASRTKMSLLPLN